MRQGPLIAATASCSCCCLSICLSVHAPGLWTGSVPSSTGAGHQNCPIPLHYKAVSSNNFIKTSYSPPSQVCLGNSQIPGPQGFAGRGGSSAWSRHGARPCLAITACSLTSRSPLKVVRIGGAHQDTLQSAGKNMGNCTSAGKRCNKCLRTALTSPLFPIKLRSCFGLSLSLSAPKLWLSQCICEVRQNPCVYTSCIRDTLPCDLPQILCSPFPSVLCSKHRTHF